MESLPEPARVTLRVPERNKQPGVCYAVSDDGVELPVVDVTHPAFALELTEPALAALTASYLADMRRHGWLPPAVQRFLFNLVTRGSALAGGMRRAGSTFLGGLDTYLFKLGAENLGAGYASALDRKIAGYAPSLALRLRLQDMARLAADSLVPALERSTSRPLLLLNIAGGPSLDSINTLLLLAREQPLLLAKRSIRIHVLDLDEAGPSFGARALAALQQEGAPLAGLDVRFSRAQYDFRRSADLLYILGHLLGESEPLLALSSEGGLFEYGSDEVVVQNLRVLYMQTPADTSIIGSVTHDGELVRLQQKVSLVPLQPRSLAAFTELAESGGFAVARSIERPICYDVLLRKNR